MSKLPPSIFNDVVGPVMRGPSSSHSAASIRIARMALDLAGGRLDEVDIVFDPNGSLATTHKSQGSDMGLFGGFLGMEADDARLVNVEQLIEESGIKIDIAIRNIGATHPNTYQLTLRNNGTEHRMTANSIGGGMIEVIEIDGFELNLAGDYFVTLILVQGNADQCTKRFEADFDADRFTVHQANGNSLIELCAQEFLPEHLETRLRDDVNVQNVIRLHPVLPVLSRKDMNVPFQSVEEMLKSGDTDQPISEFALDYECARSGLDRDAVVEKMAEINRILRNSIQQGLAGTEFKDRILGAQSGQFNKLIQSNQLLDSGSLLNRMILYVSALMEVKSSMGVIVAAPTAGSCATCPGAVLAAAEVLDVPDEVAARAMLSAGLIGVFTAIRSSFAAEVGGCQAETGAGAAMAAAALVEMAGGNTTQSLAAASMSFQNVLGLVCDPVANRVEAPCLGRNVAGAANALSSANMALAGYDPLIPLDQVLDAHREISESMPRELRCTALGGLSVTPASKAIEQRICGSCSCG